MQTEEKIKTNRSPAVYHRTKVKIGFLSQPLTGHLNPMAALARKLASRGHEVDLHEPDKVSQIGVCDGQILRSHPTSCFHALNTLLDPSTQTRCAIRIEFSCVSGLHDAFPELTA
jgi:hypothetical protein